MVFAFNQLGTSKCILLDLKKHSHVCFVGATGSGKTFACRYFMAALSSQTKGLHLIICDFKGDADFSAFSDFPSVYRYQEVKQGINHFIELFRLRQANDSVERTPLFLFIDEWAAFLTLLDKKEAEQYKKLLAELLMLGRSFNVHVILSLQRADASYFYQGTRDNFPIRIGLGKLSRESKTMMFPDLENYEPLGIGKGYLQISENDPIQIEVPQYSISQAEKLIKICLKRTSELAKR